MTPNTPCDPALAELARQIEMARAPSRLLVIGVTGSVAAGKTTLAGELGTQLCALGAVETVSTDGFLYPNAVLAARDLLQRKGFPETYDRDAMARALVNLRAGAGTFPAYSHETYDVDPALARTISAPDILILEGLGLHAPSPAPRGAGEPDVLIYLDAQPIDLETWYVARFVRFWEAAKTDASSFYARFRHLSKPDLIAFARSVWKTVNLPNLHEHILPLREVADIVVRKDASHRLEIVTDRT